MDAFGTLLSCFIQCFKSLSAGWLTGHLAQLLLETAVGSLLCPRLFTVWPQHAVSRMQGPPLCPRIHARKGFLASFLPL